MSLFINNDAAHLPACKKTWTSERGRDRDWGRAASQLGKQADAAGRLPGWLNLKAPQWNQQLLNM